MRLLFPVFLRRHFPPPIRRMRRPRGGGGRQKVLVIPARFGRPEGGKGGGEGAQGRESEHLADGCSGLGTIKDAKQRGRLRTREGGERGFLR